MNWPWSKEQESGRPVVPSAAPDGVNSVIAEIVRTNSIVSDQLGIAKVGSDALESIQIQERLFQGSEARVPYRGLDIVQVIIDSPAEDAMRNGFKIKTNYDDEYDLGTLIFNRIKKLDHRKKFTDFLKFSRLYSRGGLMYPVLIESGMIRDRSHLSESLDPRNIEKIEGLNIIHEDHFSYIVNAFDPLARGYGEIEMLHVSTMGDLDKSRFEINIQSLDIFRNRGISTLDRIYTACLALNIANWTIAHLLLRYRSLVMKYPAAEIPSMTKKKKAGFTKTSKTDGAGLKGLINSIRTTFSSKSVVAVPDTYNFEYLQTTLTGLNEGTGFLYEYLATVGETPQSIIKGSAMGQLASAEKDERSYFAKVKAKQQEGKLEPAIQFLAPMIMYEKQGEIRPLMDAHGISVSDVVVEVEFEPMEVPNPLTAAQVKLLDSQRGSIDIVQGVRDPDEVQAELYPDLDGSGPPSPMSMSPEEMQASFGAIMNPDGSFKTPQQILDEVPA